MFKNISYTKWCNKWLKIFKLNCHLKEQCFSRRNSKVFITSFIWNCRINVKLPENNIDYPQFYFYTNINWHCISVSVARACIVGELCFIILNKNVLHEIFGNIAFNMPTNTLNLFRNKATRYVDRLAKNWQVNHVRVYFTLQSSIPFSEM